MTTWRRPSSPWPQGRSPGAALVGFGLSSVVEVSSGAVVLWQIRHRLAESREQQALRMISLSFSALALYVAQDCVRALLGGDEAEAPPVGVALAAASLAVMPFLSRAQRRTGLALASDAVVADSTQSLLCTYMSAVLLGGLLLNAALGRAWADPVAGLVIAAIAVKEGRQAWLGGGCCAPTGTAGGLGAADRPAAPCCGCCP